MGTGLKPEVNGPCLLRENMTSSRNKIENFWEKEAAKKKKKRPKFSRRLHVHAGFAVVISRH